MLRILTQFIAMLCSAGILGRESRYLDPKTPYRVPLQDVDIRTFACITPKGPRYCKRGILPQIIMVIPSIETLHSTI